MNGTGDQTPFNLAFGTSYNASNLNNGYVAAFDFNNDGTINGTGDQTEFNLHFGVTLQ